MAMTAGRKKKMLSFYLQRIDDESDRVLFASIYEAYQQKLFRLAFRYLGNTAWAEECVNDAFLELIKSFETFVNLRPKQQPYYLYTVTERCAFKKFHQEKKQTALLEPLLDPAVAGAAPSAAERMDLRRAIRLLAPDYRYPLLLRYAQDQTYEEIAAVLGISVSNARQRVKRAKEKLAQLLQEEEPQHG